MRYVRFESPEGARWGVLEGDHARAIRGSLFDRWEPTGERTALAGLRLLPPCEPTKVVALGLNYRAHAAESKLPVPDEPAMFLKPTTAIIGPGDAIVHPRRSARLDYECELACVIKTRAWKVSEADALRHAIARALIKAEPNTRKVLKAAKFLKRDPRVKERKKPGLVKARKAKQWSKR